MYRIIISPQAQKQLKRINQTRHQIAISSVFEEIKEDPFIGKPLTRELTGRFSYRVGVYRVIYKRSLKGNFQDELSRFPYKINQKDQIIQVLSVGHRAYVYTLR